MSAVRKWLERRRPEAKPSEFGPIGVYFTKEHLQLVQLRRDEFGRLMIHSYESLSFPGTRSELLSSPVAVRKMVRQGMRSGDFRSRKVVSAMAPESVRVMSVSYPANGAGNDAVAIAQLMADRVEGSIHDYVIDFVPIRTSSNDGDRLALVAVSTLSDVNQYLDTLDSAGLHVDHLEIGPLAIKRLIEWGAASGKTSNVIVVSVGAATSHLTTISGQRLLADQEVKVGEESVLGALATSLNIEFEQARELITANGLSLRQSADHSHGKNRDPEITSTLIDIVKPAFLNLAREIERAFLFAASESRGDSENQLFVVGGIAQWPGAADLLSSIAHMKVEILGRNHLPRIAASAKSELTNDRDAADMSTAVGLAMRGLLTDE